MAAERFLLTRRSVSGKKLLNTAHIYLFYLSLALAVRQRHGKTQ